MALFVAFSPDGDYREGLAHLFPTHTHIGAIPPRSLFRLSTRRFFSRRPLSGIVQPPSLLNTLLRQCQESCPSLLAHHTTRPPHSRCKGIALCTRHFEPD